MRPGDWTCPRCNNHNYASRVACNRCQTPRQMAGMGMYGYQTTPYGMGAGMGAGMGTGTAMAGSTGTGATGGAGQGQTPRPGDWYCSNPSCANLNYASRVVCNRCSTPSTVGLGMAGLGGNAAMYLQQALWGLASANRGMPGMANKGGVRPGDWLCSACNNHNFASRAQCNRCQAAKPAQPQTPMGLGTGFGMGGNIRPGDWMCPDPICNNHNYANRVKCNKCGKPKPDPIDSTAGGGMGLTQSI
eukprot:NODE_1498_length_1145_cov_75.142336_g1220_i0.p1 GENE.NODE_1498_length_1145_cov_75.142336_g1220_i0~~NODE_1498_length_1145_cov_75.142336_g1220_i0.p1  ORF type:complete len:245 (+),score=46.94 NODE_1498_length_1145_cov_75.142336_g1220_i0:160-894(+)